MQDLSKISVVLPSLDPDEKLNAVIDGLLEYGFSNIILVNDGSKQENLHYFTDAAAAHPEIHLLHHEVNRGKGAALKTAFRWFLDNCPEGAGIVTVDGDPTYTLLGPEAPEDRGKIEIYTPRRTAIIVEATPTPAPIIVYCNPGGQYYHSEDCAHVTTGETPQATLEQALRAGYRQCPECNAPSELEG